MFPSDHESGFWFVCSLLLQKEKTTHGIYDGIWNRLPSPSNAVVAFINHNFLQVES
jgi:hypothetical protein